MNGANRKAVKSPAEAPRGIPQKQRFYVSEVARIMAEHLGMNEKSALNRLYYRIGDRSVQAHRYLGVVMIERDEVLRILRGDPV